jgi:hypothetical protein
LKAPLQFSDPIHGLIPRRLETVLRIIRLLALGHDPQRIVPCPSTGVRASAPPSQNAESEREFPLEEVSTPSGAAASLHLSPGRRLDHLSPLDGGFDALPVLGSARFAERTQHGRARLGSPGAAAP